MIIDRAHHHLLAAAALVLVGLLPIFANPASYALALIALGTVSVRVLSQHKVAMALFWLYFAGHFLFSVATDEAALTVGLTQSYVILAVLMPALLCLGIVMGQHRSALHLWLPLGTCASVVVLALEMIVDNECRVSGHTFHPLLTCAIYTVLAMLILWQWREKTQRQRALAFFTIGLVVIALISLAVGRAAFAALALSLTLVALRKDGPGLRLYVVLFASMVAAVPVAYLSGCGQVERFLSLAQGMLAFAELTQNADARLMGSMDAVMSTGIEESGSTRVALWNGALQAIAERPWLGFGRHLESELINRVAETDHAHAHNQYFSWMIWGGVPGLLLGLAMLAVPFVNSQDKVHTALILGPLYIIFLTDSLYYWPQSLFSFTCLLCVLYGVFQPQDRAAEAEADA